MKIQNPYNCNNYTPNTNMNLTCKGKKRCIIYYEVNCPEYDNIQDCSKCKRLTIETYTGVCDLFGVLDGCYNKCDYFKGKR